ncbi:ParB N-terminal domain-containing protein [Leptospira andrefontaineae]|uniref:Chromosome partitioning protein n=1 Tax=Leptospira andrefontaineae TaxID=2484976 RepID=A0A4R9H6M3_9LEPT|nr:ParB N-terminal domain-containing protein [Leptospira andrefontaineae]TGK41251.1 chromosome partitioning protein [Leptospira andrefontaineae]
MQASKEIKLPQIENGERTRLTVALPLNSLYFHPKNEELFGIKSEETITSLAEDIRINGLQEPISVKPTPGNKYMVLSGETRVRAIRLLGWEMCPGYLVSPKDELSYLISRNAGRIQLVFNMRLRIYKEVCPEFYEGKKITLNRLVAISRKTRISTATLKSDLKKIRKGAAHDLTIEQLRELWDKKRIKNVRINVSDMGANGFELQVHGKNIEYKFGPGTFKKVVREAAEAAQSVWFEKNYKEANLETAGRIKELRKEAKLTQLQLAQLLGYSQSYFAELEGGKWECTNALLNDICQVCEEYIEKRRGGE